MEHNAALGQSGLPLPRLIVGAMPRGHALGFSLNGDEIEALNQATLVWPA